MSDTGEKSERATALERLMMLQRLRDQAITKNSESMLRTIEGMIEAEGRVLWGNPESPGPEPAAAGRNT